MVSVVIFGVGTGYVFITKAWVEHQARAQAQQSLRAAVGDVSRELRITGACMGITWVDQNAPLASNYKMLAGTSGPPDTFTRTANPQCAGPAKLTADCAQCTTISVDNILNFTAGTWGFIGYGSVSQAGEYFLIQSVDTGGGTITVSGTTPLLNTYLTTTDLNPTFVAGADQRTFAVSSSCTGCNGVPTLTLQQLGDTTGQPLVKGITSMTVQYVLNRAYNAGSCTSQTGGTNSLCIVQLPETTPSVAGDWKLVRAVIVSLSAQSILPVRGNPSGFFQLSESVEISPRNFIFSPNGSRILWTPY